ncbi:MAG: NAD(P)-binding domain-containing protein [Deltaproteobacteria bacterium]|nr:NAD(P)-binding domain-containing protein [Deltaproteobacteria bacterium]
MIKYAVIGSGQVGQVLADGLLASGHEVMRGSREPSKLADWQKKAGEKAHIGTFAEAAQWGEQIVLAVKGSAAESAIALAGPENLAGKVVIDATNPIADAPPEHGVLRFFTNHDESLMERLQRGAKEARFVKAFSCVGNAFMVHPKFAGGPPSMFICGNDAAAKESVQALLTDWGWETVDMGAAESARAIEPLCMLWCIPGFTKNRWTHAFKLLQA